MRHQGNKEFADLVGVDVTQLRDVSARLFRNKNGASEEILG